MANFDLRTLYRGDLSSSRARIEEVNSISQKVSSAIIEALESSTEGDQVIVRNKLANLAMFEAQVNDLLIRMDGIADQAVVSRVQAIVTQLRQGIQRLERILISIMNTDNNSR